MTDLFTVWRATFVRRWHKSPDFYDSGDMQHGHAGRMAVMSLWLWPDDYELAAACVLHDMGEGGEGPGDVCGLSKARAPRWAARAAQQEQIAYSGLGLPAVQPDSRVRLLDRLDAYLWAMLHKPWLGGLAKWEDAAADILDLCEDEAEATEAEVMQAVHDVTSAYRGREVLS